MSIPLWAEWCLRTGYVVNKVNLLINYILYHCCPVNISNNI